MPAEPNTSQAMLLVVEDDRDLRTQMKWGLAGDYSVIEAGDRESALKVFAKDRPPVLTLDLGLPPDPDGVGEGFRVLEEVLETDPQAKVIVITGRDERSNALEALRKGAYDFLPKPVSLEDLKIILKRAYYISNLEKDLRDLKSREGVEPFEGILGNSPQIGKVFERIRKVSGTDVPVLIVGESGTGKELAAKAIHARSSRSEGPFIAINCGAIPENLLESELFGHEKGAFTGAHVQRKGRIELARGGTLFLDEIGELTLSLQVKILRFLQDGGIERVGGRESITVDARIIAATNRDLEKAMRENQFREDLYYRLSVVTIRIPSLREREGDILLLARYFLNRFSRELSGAPMEFTVQAERALESHSWPGNVREMENRIKRAVIMAEGKRIKPADLEIEKGKSHEHGGETLKKAREDIERNMIIETIKTQKGNLSNVARVLGISRPALYDLMKKLDIPRPD